MRWYAMGLTGLALAGCGAKYKADGPVLEHWERVRGWSDSALSQARYSGQPIVAAPVVPVLAFGARLDLGVSLRPAGPDWDSHEIGRMETAAGPLWLAIETRGSDLEQVLVADVPEIDAFMPEIPFERKKAAFQVTDGSNTDGVQFAVKYENSVGELVEVTVASDPPFNAEDKRNSPALGRSEDVALVVMDVEARQSAFDADIKVGGRGEGMDKMGLVPYQFVGTESIGGLAVGSFAVVPTKVFSFDSSMSQVVVTRQGEAAPPPAAPAAPAAADPLSVALSANKEHLQGCWTTLAKDKPALAGQVLLAFKVDATKAGDLKVVNNTTADDALAACLSEKVGEVVFPADITGDLAFPFEFAAGTGLVLNVAAPSGDLPEADLPESTVLTRPEPADTTLERPTDDLLGAEDPDAAAPVDPAYGPALANFDTVHQMRDGATVTLGWEVSRKGDRVYATQHSDVRTLTYEYLVHHDALELARISVTQFGQTAPTTEVSFSPALPDLRRPFDGRQKSQYVIDMNGEDNFAVGTAEAWWTESGVKLKIAPEEPEWTVGRTLTTTINYSGGQAAVLTQRLE